MNESTNPRLFIHPSIIISCRKICFALGLSDWLSYSSTTPCPVFPFIFYFLFILNLFYFCFLDALTGRLGLFLHCITDRRCTVTRFGIFLRLGIASGGALILD
ncbi:hypothetical protein HOY80DRAFT_967160 [Tuber brumale]|nr:hypothetical protein HOY80DRAFT_967160 [Tuber brumale]